MRLYKNVMEFKTMISVEYNERYALQFRLLGYINKYNRLVDISIKSGNIMDYNKYKLLYDESVNLYLEGKMFMDNLVKERDRLTLCLN